MGPLPDQASDSIDVARTTCRTRFIEGDDRPRHRREGRGLEAARCGRTALVPPVAPCEEAHPCCALVDRIEDGQESVDEGGRMATAGYGGTGSLAIGVPQSAMPGLGIVALVLMLGSLTYLLWDRARR
jgi:hypothetical protein